MLVFVYRDILNLFPAYQTYGRVVYRILAELVFVPGASGPSRRILFAS